ARRPQPAAGTGPNGTDAAAGSGGWCGSVRRAGDHHEGLAEGGLAVGFEPVDQREDRPLVDGGGAVRRREAEDSSADEPRQRPRRVDVADLLDGVAGGAEGLGEGGAAVAADVTDAVVEAA